MATIPSSDDSLDLPFRPRARLLQLLGDQLIGTPRLAVFELVKNAYDADAETVTVTLKGLRTASPSIVVEDDGDGMAEFTIEEAARALVYEKTGRYVLPLANALDPLGALYIDWINRLKAAAYDDDSRFWLCITRCKGNETDFIQRDDLRDWCLWHGMKPKFLYPKDTPESFERMALEVAGYEPTEELLVMIEAIKKFWANADRAKPPKKDEEIIPWILERVDSASKASAIDLLIRPEWARAGGNKKQAKG